MKLVCFKFLFTVYPVAKGWDIKHTTRFMKTVSNKNSFQILYIRWADRKTPYERMMVNQSNMRNNKNDAISEHFKGELRLYWMPS